MREPAFCVGEKVFFGAAKEEGIICTIEELRGLDGRCLYKILPTAWPRTRTFYYESDMTPLPPLERLAWMQKLNESLEERA